LARAAIVALLHRKEDGRNALDWHGLYEDSVGINETEGDLSRDEAEENAFKYCCHTWRGLNPVMLSDCVCPHCSDGPESGNLLLHRGDAWVHESCESAWSQARQAEAAVDDLGAILDWTPPFSLDCCAQCGEQLGDALYYAETYGVHESCTEALSQAREAEATAALWAMGLRPPADTDVSYDLAIRSRGWTWGITIRKGLQENERCPIKNSEGSNAQSGGNL
jgi:hypothetical protein